MLNTKNIPGELKQLKQWVLWRFIHKINQKKPAKVPYQVSGQEAGTNNPDTWNDFEAVNNKFSGNGKNFSGIGFVFSETDPYVGIDFDDCVDETGNIKEEVLNWVEKFASYTEYSQSKRGIHIICKGVKPGHRKQKGNIEIYDRVRYFVFTGNVINNFKEIKTCQDAINEFYYTVFKEEEEEEKTIQKEYKRTYSPPEDKEEFYNKVLQVLEERGQGLFSDYNEYFRFCMACKNTGFAYESIDLILQQSKNYNYTQNIKMYEKLVPDGRADFGTVYYFAKKADNYRLNELLTAKKEYAVAKFGRSSSPTTEEKQEVLSVAEEIIKKKVKKKSKADILFEVEDFFRNQYKFRFNVITYKPEYSPLGSDNWIAVDDGFEAACYFQLIRNNIYFSKDDIHTLFINPDFSPPVDPLKEYFDSLLYDNQRDYIKDYTDCFILLDEKERKNFEIMFKKWFVAILTSIYNDKFCNQCIFIVVGEQGEGKTTFLNNLVPPTLKTYHQNGGIDFLSKDSQLAMAGKLLINIDELESFSKQDIDLLKSRVTALDFDVRPPYKKHSIKFKKRCSFMASTNKTGFLSDPTGSRRFLINNILKIDYKRDINIDQMYAQAKELYFSGFTYFFNKDEIKYLTQRNEMYAIESIEEQLLLKHYQPGEDLFLSATELAGELEKKGDFPVRVDSLFVRKLGTFLTKHGFKRKGVKGRYVWCVSEKKYRPGFEQDLPVPF